MKVAILSESPADEAAVRILVDAVLCRSTERVDLQLRSRGWPAVSRVITPVLRHLHYHTDAVGLILVVDTDESELHEAHHGIAGGSRGNCRVCQLWNTVNALRPSLRPVKGKAPIKVAVGHAMPAIEAWYLCGIDALASESEWRIARTRRQILEGKLELKLRTYGTTRPGLQLEKEKAVEHAKRIASNIADLQNAFPNGFGSLATDLQSW